MPSIAHLGDPLTHGGTVIEGSPDVFADERAVARVGDKAMCAEHGIVQIATGAQTVYANGRLVAIDGSVCSCGALVRASGTVYVED
ncbi:MAG: PAAR domain-containing protein [Gammaproteobacteria bacterium]|nr:PAAR domain-containing protein [Gammaproteobacteria bacterium]